MLLYDKFESRSSRAKAVAFHPTRPWLLAGLYSSTIQLWDYRMGCIIDRFEGHQGPVRGLDVHPTQQMFVSGGDDQLVRVWSLADRRLLFTLEGHQDYVRTVFFHKELPWIVSASDDQTIRVWDWQARKCIATLTGHNHWVSCAVFHPFEDLIISASLDCSVRAWDITGLKRRYSAAGVLPGQTPGQFGAGGFPPNQFGAPGFPPNQFPPGFPGNPGFPGGFGPPPGGFDDPFGGEVVTKFILEGHDRGVTCVACHPTQPLIVSASDDRTLKVWRMSEARAWEIDTCRGHRDEVTGCVFSTQSDAIVSCSTDETVRVWGLNHRSPMATFPFGKESADRLWSLATHPTVDLIALARDNGLLVFKLRPERPAITTQPSLAVADNGVLKTGDGRVLANMEMHGENTSMRLKRVHYNPAENSFLAFHWRQLSENKDSAVVSLFPSGRQDAGPLKKQVIANATDAMFLSRNRIGVIAGSSLLVHDLDLQQTKELTLPFEAKFLFEGPAPGQVYIAGPTELVLFDWQQARPLAQLKSKQVKQLALSADGRFLALGASHDIQITTPQLKPVRKIEETIKLKSLVWDARLPVLLYTTSSHLKYVLSNGDGGVLKTLRDPQYLVKASGEETVLATRRGRLEFVEIDPTEYRFKLALVNRDFAEVARLIETSQLVGQSIIAYLQKSGFPEIALGFVADPKTRFDLAVESGNLAVAAKAAAQLQSAEFDERLAAAALEQGNHDLLEDVYQRQRDFDKLAFVYLATGNRTRLQRVEQLAMRQSDASTRFQTSLLLNSVENRIELLLQAGLAPLAYALAKSSGLADEAEQILADHEIDEKDTKITLGGGLGVPAIKHETWQANWPVKKVENVDIETLKEAQLRDRAAGAGAGGAGAGLDSAVASGATAGAAAAGGATAGGAEEADVGDAWDLGDEDLGEEMDVEAPTVVNPSARELWVQNSTVPADHIAAGSFETAAQLLNRQIGVVKFDALKPRFFDVFQGSKLAMPGHELLPPLEYTVGRASGVLPFVPGLDHLGARLDEAFTQVRANQLELAVESFRGVLHTAVTLAVDTEAEEQEVRRAIDTCRNYILAFSIELKRRSLPKEDVKRNLELAAYFTKPQLRKAHAGLPLRTACMQAAAAKNYALASHFAQEYLKIDSTGPGGKKMAASKAKWDAAKTLDAVDIDFDMFGTFDIDPRSLTPIYDGQPAVIEPLTRAKYHAENRGSLCAITQFTEVGAPAAGLRLRA